MQKHRLTSGVKLGGAGSSFLWMSTPFSLLITHAGRTTEQHQRSFAGRHSSSGCALLSNKREEGVSTSSSRQIRDSASGGYRHADKTISPSTPPQLGKLRGDKDESGRKNTIIK